MNRHDVILKLATARAMLQRHGVKRLRLFGSTARGDASDTSDVDFLVEFDDRPVGLFGLARLQRDLQNLLGVEHVDLVTPEAIHPALRQQILSEALDAA